MTWIIAGNMIPQREQASPHRLLSAVLLLLLTAVPLTGALRQTLPLVTGLDHIIILVNNLEAAASRYRAMGFALKPGRPHDNGIRNQHVKFEDGTELELLTAPEAKDTAHGAVSPLPGSGRRPRARRAVRARARMRWRRRIVGGEFGAQHDGLITLSDRPSIASDFLWRTQQVTDGSAGAFRPWQFRVSLTRAWVATLTTPRVK